jgi:hypothetical protein
MIEKNYHLLHKHFLKQQKNIWHHSVDKFRTMIETKEDNNYYIFILFFYGKFIT